MKRQLGDRETRRQELERDNKDITGVIQLQTNLLELHASAECFSNLETSRADEYTSWH